VFFQSSTQGLFRFSNVSVFTVPTWNFIDDALTFASTPQRFLASFPEARTVLSLMLGQYSHCS